MLFDFAPVMMFQRPEINVKTIASENMNFVDLRPWHFKSYEVLPYRGYGGIDVSTGHLV